jgi:putative flippase GtrA
MKIKKEFIKQILLYGIIGGCSALLDFVLFYFLYRKLSINEFIANVITVHAGIALSFTLNRKFNFKKTDRIIFRASSFYLTGLSGLALSELLLWAGSNLKFPVLPTKFGSIFIVALVQFTSNKLIAFGR